MYSSYSCPYCYSQAMQNLGYYNGYPSFTPFYNNPYSYQFAPHPFGGTASPDHLIALEDHGPKPFVVDLEKATEQNNTYRTALWTGNHLQLTLMSINVGEDIGLEIHPHLDQFIRIEEGRGLVQMGNHKDNLNFQREVYDGFAFFIPAGTWHNLTNTGDKPIKLYSIYAPVQHPHGTVQQTKAIAEAEEKH
ncbi:cupin domain-containing protein [Rummeliibacillus suwonensis]|uniref:cupin domain-containing protein n=1 Tax=Rummeliibacillus suwonensis TaxID=1306154 RepID=UPI0011B3B002|nr:cupin domain-containing protein [Rummeliibacillus suwonensis]